MTQAVTPVKKFTLKQRVRRRSDKLMNYFLAIYFIGGLICACFYHTWVTALLGGSAWLLIYYAVKKYSKESDFYQYVLSGILGMFMSQYIFQMHGMFEIYFFAFVGSTILIMYQNWKLQIPLFIIVIFHLSVFGYHDHYGISDPYAAHLSAYETERFILHIMLGGLIFFICGLWGYLLNKYSGIQIAQTAEMERLQQEALTAVKEQAVIESNNRLSYAAQATSDAIWDRNYSEDQVFWGDGYRSLFGYDCTGESASVSFWTSKVHPDDLPVISAIVQKAKDDVTANSWAGEYRFRRANGEYAYVREKAIILRDENGIPCRTIGALQDITESKQSELTLKNLNESLEKEKYYLDLLMDNMPDSIYFKDKESRFLRVSKYLAGKFSTTVDELIGKSDFDFHDEVNAEQTYRDEQEIQQTRTPKIDYIEKSIRKDGTELWMSSTKMPLINSRSEVVGTFGVTRDITKIKSLEKQQHEAALDRAVAQGKFEIASEVMHDIGNAVVGFGAYLSRIKRLQDADNLDNLCNLMHFFVEQKEAFTAAIGAVKTEALINMISGMAATQQSNREETAHSVGEQLNIIANIESILSIQRQYISGHESKERKPADLKLIIHDSLAMLVTPLEHSDVEVSVNIAENLPPIRGDRTKLMQLMLNILKNSMEAMSGNTGGKHISVQAFTESNRLILQVKDNGSGFDPSLGPSFFTRGFTTKSEGSGLSLYNCRTIVESHEGTIDMQSEGTGRGATTTIGFKILAA